MAALESARPVLHDAMSFARTIWWRFNEDRCLAAAASLSYTSLLALVPLTAIGVAVMSAFPVFDAARAELMSFMFQNVVPSAVESIQEYLNSFVGKAQELTAVGVIGLAVTSLLLFATIEAAIDVIFKSPDPRSMVGRLLVFWAILTLGPLLIGASFSIATLAYTYTESVGALSEIVAVVANITPALLVIAAFSMFFWIIPNRPVRLRHALIGGTVAGILFSVLRWGLTLYVTTFPLYRTVYGAIAIVPIFLIWMYLSWAAILLGGVVAAELPTWGRERPRDVLPTEPGARLALALTLLGALYKALFEGHGLRRRRLVSVCGAATPFIDTMLSRLRHAGLVERTDNGHWLPVRDASMTTLYDVVRALSLDLRVEHVRGNLGNEAWEQRVIEIIEADSERERDLMSISLRTLILGAESGAAEREPVAAALPLRRSP